MRLQFLHILKLRVCKLFQAEITIRAKLFWISLSLPVYLFYIQNKQKKTDNYQQYWPENCNKIMKVGQYPGAEQKKHKRKENDCQSRDKKSDPLFVPVPECLGKNDMSLHMNTGQTLQGEPSKRFK